MKLLISTLSLSAGDHGFTKGDRVVCKIAKDEWYIGTVKRAGAKIYVDFDDGADAVIEPADFKHVKLMTTAKKLKRSLTDAEAKALFAKAVAKPAPKTTPAPKAAKPVAPISKAPLPIKKPIALKPTAKPAPIPKPAPAPIPKPVPEVKPTPAPVVTPAPQKKLEERKFKNNWIVQIEGHGKSTWRYTVKDDPENPSFKYRASSMVATPQKALQLALWELKNSDGTDRTHSFTLTYQPPVNSVEEFKVHTLEKLTIENAESKLSDLIKSLVPPPKLNKPIAPPAKTPIHTPTPTPEVKPTHPIVEKDDFQLYLIPDNDPTTGKWSYALKQSPNAPRFFHTSDAVHNSPRAALDYGLNAMPDKFIHDFTLVFVESLKGNAIDRKVVFEHVSGSKCYEIVDRLMAQMQQTVKETWFLHVINDGAKTGGNNWRWQVNNYEAQMRHRPGFVQPTIPFHEESTGHYPTALDAFFEAIKHVVPRTFTLQVWKGLGNYTNEFKNVDKLQAAKELEHLFGSASSPVEDRPDVNALYLKCGNEKLFAYSHGGDQGKINYMTDVWHRANKLIFDNRLKFPSILRFLKEQSTDSFRRRGHWARDKREIAMSRRVFNAGEEKFLEIFVHEMCHQAVSEIDRVVDTNMGHGPYWTAWMVKAGIPPSRYDTTDTQEYMDDEEKENHQAKLDGLKKAAQELNNLTPVSNYSSLGTPAQFYWADKKQWVQGVIVGIYGDKMYVVTNSKTGAYMMLSNKGADRLFQIPIGTEMDNYALPHWREAAERVQRHIEFEQVKKKLKKDGRLPPGAEIRRLLGM